MAYVGFDKLAGEVGSKGLAAYIGRKKYGKGKFQSAAARGESLRGARPAGGAPKYRGKRRGSPRYEG
jgi:hypothetical protein